MIEIFLFAASIMYTPGPVNMLSLFSGISGHGFKILRFFAGVSTSMGVLFIVLGYLGAEVITPAVQAGIALFGGAYIGYLGVKLLMSEAPTSQQPQLDMKLTFLTGFLMQSSNPKAAAAIAPITGVQFPAVGVEGWQIIAVSSALAVIAFGAPFVYFLVGKQISSVGFNPKVLLWINRVMGAVLAYIAVQFLLQAWQLLS